MFGLAVSGKALHSVWMNLSIPRLTRVRGLQTRPPLPLLPPQKLCPAFPTRILARLLAPPKVCSLVVALLLGISECRYSEIRREPPLLPLPVKTKTRTRRGARNQTLPSLSSHQSEDQEIQGRRLPEIVKSN